TAMFKRLASVALIRCWCKHDFSALVPYFAQQVPYRLLYLIEGSLGFAPLLSFHCRSCGTHCLEGLLRIFKHVSYLCSRRVDQGVVLAIRYGHRTPLAVPRLAATFHPWPLFALMNCQREAACFVATVPQLPDYRRELNWVIDVARLTRAQRDAVIRVS